MPPKEASDSKQTVADGAGDAPPTKPARTLNRVPRACNGCRKQKMRCEGADNPPCRRCRHAGLECLFEKPVRDTSTSEAGLERIRNLEGQVSSIQSTLSDLVTALRAGQHVPPQSAPSPPTPVSNGTQPRFIPYVHSTTSDSPPSASSSSHHHQPHHHHRPVQFVNEHVSSERDYPHYQGPSSPGRRHSVSGGHQRADSRSTDMGDSPPASHAMNFPATYGNLPTGIPMQPGQPQLLPSSTMAPPTSLPPFSSLQHGGAHNNQHLAYPPGPGSPHRGAHHHSPQLHHGPPYAASGSSNGRTRFPPPGPPNAYASPHVSFSSSPSHSGLPTPLPQDPHSTTHPLHHLRHLPIPSSNVTSADSSDDEGELPTSGLIAPISVLRGLADNAARNADNGESISAPPTRPSSPDGHQRADRPQGGRASKRRKIAHSIASAHAQQIQYYPDVVTKEIISEKEARELFDIFYRGCSTFLPVFDSNVDTFDTLHKRSPFCVNAICMVAAKVRDGGGPEGEVYKKCFEEVQKISSATMFAPVTRQEAIQATVIIAGWSSDGGWLSLGHAVRMAHEISMHKTWPRLLKRIKAGKMRVDQDERELVISTRTWFCLYIFEHQLSFGTGRPAILHEDESIQDCRALLSHPLAIEDDLRLVSMVELAIIRERLHNKLVNADAHTHPSSYAILSSANDDFSTWHKYWDDEFSKRYGDETFYRQSLTVQRDFAELFHNATALRGVRGHEDVKAMPEEQRALALRSIAIAKDGLSLCLRTSQYREGLRYAVHFTHVSATFAGSFLIRLARLFPNDVNLRAVMLDVDDLALVLSTIPATRYARTLKLMLQRARQRRVLPPRSHPGGPVDPSAINGQPSILGPLNIMNTNDSSDSNHLSTLGNGPTTSPTMSNASGGAGASGSLPLQSPTFTTGFDNFAPGFQMADGQELPVWMSESNLGDLALSQYGLEAFLIPQQFDDLRAVPEIW